MCSTRLENWRSPHSVSSLRTRLRRASGCSQVCSQRSSQRWRRPLLQDWSFLERISKGKQMKKPKSMPPPSNWHVVPGAMWPMLGLVLLLFLNSGCGLVLRPSQASEKLPRPKIPALYLATTTPHTGLCDVGSGEPVPCVVLLADDLLGLLKERETLLHALKEADHTLCLVNHDEDCK